MSTKRRTVGCFASPPPTNEKGEKLCRNCRAVLPKGRRYNNCSPKCSEEWAIKTSPDLMRHAVFNRDGGICALCQVDVFALAFYKNGNPRTRRSRGSGDLWQADHILPVIEGGGECGLEGYRTLCTACHQKVTKELRERMSRRRRDEKALANDRSGLFADQVESL